MKVTLTDKEGPTVLTEVQEIIVNPYGDVAITQADETKLFKIDEETQLRIRVEPEPMNTRTKSAAAIMLATLPECDRCRPKAGPPDVLMVCACPKWCGLEICLADDLTRGPSVLDPIDGSFWDTGRDAVHDQAAAAAQVAKEEADKGSAG